MPETLEYDTMIENMDFFAYAEQQGFGEIHVKFDPKTKLQAIVAIHSTKLGPALGGCRFLEYPSTEKAATDALRLARAMSFKAAVLGLPHGGGKSVLMKRPDIDDRGALFEAFGRMINDLNGRYITAVDSGTSIADMDVIHSQTDYVTSLSGHSENTSEFTAHGVFIGMQASIQHAFKTRDFKGLRVAIQGLGNVGFDLARRLHEAGAELFVTDVNTDVVNAAVKQFNATPVAINEIHKVEADVFSPCALGGSVNENTISQLKAKVIAGCANNQLSKPSIGRDLHYNGILYAPDYVINAGGLVYAAGRYDHVTDENINDSLQSISASLTTIYQRSEQEDKPTSMIADLIAQERLS